LIDGKLWVVTVWPYGPAEKAGLKRGDIIVSANEHRVAGKPKASIVAQLQGKAGEPVKLAWRAPGSDGVMQTKIGRIRPQDFPTSQNASKASFRRLFADRTTVLSIGADLQMQGGVPVITSLYQGGSANQAGLLPGDAVLAVNGHATKPLSLREVDHLLLGDGGTELELTIQRLDEEKTENVILKREGQDEAIHRISEQRNFIQTPRSQSEMPFII